MSETGSPPPAAAPVLSPLKRAFLALEAAEARVAELERAAREPIAVIGIGCRVPGADDPATFWSLLEKGEDLVGPTPPERWDGDALFDPDPDVPGRIAAKRAGFLRGPVDRFDAGVFGIAPREAQGMDPQQRLLLEVAWEALEHAGKAPNRLERSLTGIYVGVTASDYANIALKTLDPSLLDAHFTSGVAHSIASGRISYLLGLQGPSVTIDTACSSSLVAVHLACQALRSGDCTMALAGGVSLMLAPDLTIALSRARMLSVDGRCKTFDASADGFARGEGCGVIVLKRLRDAQAEGDRILAVIRGSAVNQDGPSGSLTAPNGPAQEAVIREALARAGLSPRDVGYIEAHGTGTQLGDPLEVQALGAVFGPGRDPAEPLWLASVKTNIGHLEAAAGVVGLIKVVLSMLQRSIAPHLHFRNPSPHIPWAELPFRVPTARSAWEPIGGRRVAGVSSFGFSGTNAHVVLEEGPRPAAPARAAGVAPNLLVLSARDEGALREVAKRYAAAVAGRPDAELADICFTANVGRAHLACRAAIVARSVEELARRLEALGRGEPAEGVTGPRVAPRDPPRVAFLFTGQGAQYAGMARGLYEASPVFRAALDEAAALLGPRLARPLLEVVFPPSGAATPLDATAFTQPALFAIEVALAELWRSWGVTPSAVMGHSVGEFAAAHLAGVLGLEDAARLVAERGRLMQSLPAGGAMAAIFAPEEAVVEAVAPYAAKVAVAAVNAPGQTVVSGAAAEVDALCRALSDRGVRCKPLAVSHAFHSPLVEPILAAFEREAAAVRLAPPRLPLVSNVTGAVAEPAELTRPAYWRRHVREAVRFGEGLKALAALRPDVAIEIGPQPTLLAFAKAAYGAGGPLLLASLRKGQPDAAPMLDAAAALYLEGADLDFRAIARDLAGGAPRSVVDLPTYPFQRERYWLRARPAAAPVARGRATGHPLLGARLRTAGAEAVFESRLSADTPAFVRDHRVLGRVIMPATGYVETLLAAARALGMSDACVADVTVGEAMLFEDDGSARTVQVVCGAARDGAVPVSLFSAPESDEGDAWTLHVSADLRAVSAPPAPGPSLEALRARCSRPVTAAEHYAGYERRGLGFGDRFKVVREVWCGEREALGVVELTLATRDEADAYAVHPLLLDGCLQLVAGAVASERDDVLFLPIGVGSFTRYRSPGTRCWGHVLVHDGAGEARRAEIRLLGDDGALLAELRDLQVKRVSRGSLERIGDRWLDACLYETAWREAPLPAGASAAPPRKEWLLLADRGGVAATLAEKLTARGARCVLLPADAPGGASAEALRRLLADRRAEGRAPEGVVHAWSLDGAPWDAATSDDLARAQSHGATSALLLAQALVAEGLAPRLWFLTRGAQQADALDRALDPAQAPVWGLAKSVRREHPELGATCVDVDPAEAAPLDALLAELGATGEEPEVALRRGARRVPRLVRRARPRPVAGERARAPYRLVPAARGSLDAFELAPLDRRAPGPGEVEVRVEATGMNFRDVLNVLGMYPGDPGPIGGECAGTVVAVGPGVTHVKPGDDVFAVAAGSFASHVVTGGELVQRRPAGVGAEEGAAFPIAFLTAAFCLDHVAKLRAGERVLIHAAAGGVGMAAVRVAQRAGAEVFATAGSAWKRDLLRSMGVAHTLDSRSASFADAVLERTGGRGVDVVLNSLTGDLIDASFRALAEGGRFVEIGKRGIKDHAWVASLGRRHAYTIVDWSDDARREPAVIGGMFAKLVDELREGKLAPLPRHVFALDEASRAFRFMAQARHVGRIVVRHGGPPPASVRADGTYLVTGGLSGIGPAVAEWLVARGAGKVVLVSRRGVTPSVSALLAPLRDRGSAIVAESVDVTDEAALGALLDRLRREGPPLRGVVHGAGVLADASLLQQDAAKLAAVCAPKVRGGWLLDELTRGEALDWFVLFSSAASVVGAPGQANYAAANAFLDVLARERRSRGLPGLSVNWGGWSEVGMAAERGTLERLAAQGMGALTPEQGRKALERAIDDGSAQVAVVPGDWRRYAAQTGGGRAPPMLAELLGESTREGASPLGPSTGPARGQEGAPSRAAAGAATDLRAQLAGVPQGRWKPTVAAFVRARALGALGMAPDRPVDPSAPLGELGLDSLLAVELRNTLSAALGRPMPATLLFDCPTIDALTGYILREALGVREDGAEAPPPSAIPQVANAADLVGAIEELSDEEVERQLGALAGSNAG